MRGSQGNGHAWEVGDKWPQKKRDDGMKGRTVIAVAEKGIYVGYLKESGLVDPYRLEFVRLG